MNSILFHLLLQNAVGQEESVNQDNIIDLQIEKYELDNGLDVILSEDHSVPFVQVNLWYNVGSKDEEEGRTGFAHLFEHLMFQGSQHHDTEYFAPLQPIGARINGTTSFDRTNYFEGVPSEYLPLALWLESDRMGYLLPALSEDKLSNQKDVVRNERRQRYEIRPYGEVWPWLFENLYPEGHPYHVPTIGKHEDIENATMDDVQNFFVKWYVPNNATLTICGDFDPEIAKKLVKQYFGSIPRGKDPSPVLEAPAELTEEKIIRKEDPLAPQSKVWIAWLTPKLYAKGDADLDVFSSVFADGKDSPLYKYLVYEKQLAKDVNAYQYSTRLQGQYMITATASEGHTTDELVEAIDTVLQNFKETGTTDEDVSIAKVNWEKRFYESLQTIANKADMLSSYNTMTGNPAFINDDLNRYLAVTPESVLTAATTYLQPDKRIVLHVTPAEKTSSEPEQTIENTQDESTEESVSFLSRITQKIKDLFSRKSDNKMEVATEETTVQKQTDAKDVVSEETKVSSREDAQKPSALDVTDFKLPELQKGALSNGIPVIVSQNHEVPLVYVQMVFNAGSWVSNEENPNLASATMDMLNEGAGEMDAAGISAEQQRLAASINSSASLDGSSIFLSSLRKNLNDSLGLMATISLQPTFPEKDWEILQRKYVQDLKAKQEDPSTIAVNAMNFLMYGGKYAGVRNSSEQINAVSTTAMKEWYSKYITPNSAQIVVGGDVTLEEVLPMLETHFGSWSKQSNPLPETPSPKNVPLRKSDKITIYFIDKPGASQSVIRMGQFVNDRSAENHEELYLANLAVGGLFISRLNMNLREDKGWTYGARSWISYNHLPGLWTMSTSVVADKTALAVNEILRELRGSQLDHPIQQEELDASRGYILGTQPLKYENPNYLLSRTINIDRYKLPEDWYSNYNNRIREVSLESAQEVWNTLIDPSNLVILIVGDSASLLNSLQDLGLSVEMLSSVDFEIQPSQP
jgi:zinc protease